MALAAILLPRMPNPSYYPFVPFGHLVVKGLVLIFEISKQNLIGRIKHNQNPIKMTIGCVGFPLNRQFHKTLTASRTTTKSSPQLMIHCMDLKKLFCCTFMQTKRECLVLQTVSPF